MKSWIAERAVFLVVTVLFLIVVWAYWPSSVPDGRAGSV
jgi:hypothetical protein